MIMMHSKNPLSFSSIPFSLSIIFSLHSLLNAASLVPNTCNRIVQSDADVEYPFCLRVLESNPGSATATFAQLGDISFQLGISKTISISSKIATLLKDPKFGDPSTKDALKDCSEVYSDAHNALQKGLKAFKDGDYSTADTRVNAALVVPPTCQDGFTVSPLTKENSDFFQLAAISLGFIDLLQKVN